jgi:hypothetical protein
VIVTVPAVPAKTALLLAPFTHTPSVPVSEPLRQKLLAVSHVPDPPVPEVAPLTSQ